MLLIDTYVGPSPIEGVGVFAAEPIKAGQVVWVLNQTLDRIISHVELQELPAVQQAFIQRYAYFDASLGGFLLDGDNARFLNHADASLIRFAADGCGYAVREVAADEELTCDYREFMPEFTIFPTRLPPAMRIKSGH